MDDIRSATAVFSSRWNFNISGNRKVHLWSWLILCMFTGQAVFACQIRSKNDGLAEKRSASQTSAQTTLNNWSTQIQANTISGLYSSAIGKHIWAKRTSLADSRALSNSFSFCCCEIQTAHAIAFLGAVEFTVVCKYSVLHLICFCSLTWRPPLPVRAYSAAADRPVTSNRQSLCQLCVPAFSMCYEQTPRESIAFPVADTLHVQPCCGKIELSLRKSLTEDSPHQSACIRKRVLQKILALNFWWWNWDTRLFLARNHEIQEETQEQRGAGYSVRKAVQEFCKRL